MKFRASLSDTSYAQFLYHVKPQVFLTGSSHPECQFSDRRKFLPFGVTWQVQRHVPCKIQNIALFTKGANVISLTLRSISHVREIEQQARNQHQEEAPIACTIAVHE